MKSRLRQIILIIVIMSVMAVGCSSREPAPQPTAHQVETTTPTIESQSPLPEPENTSAPLTEDPWAGIDPSNQQIDFWHIFDAEREQVLAELVTKFNRTNQYGIQVQTLNQGSYVDIYNRILEAVTSGSSPDILVAFQNQAAEYRLRDGIIDLNQLVSSDRYGYTGDELQAFYTGVWQSDVFPSLEGQRLGVPFYRSVDLVYYNADWLESLGYHLPPETPEQFSEMVCAASANPFHPELPDQTTGALFFADASRVAAWVYAFGGDFYDLPNLRFELNNDLAKGTMSYLTGLIAAGCAAQSSAWDYDQEQFIAGKTLFMFGSSNLIAYFSQLQKDGKLDFRWEITSYPHLTPEPVSNSYGISMAIGNTTPERELAAFLFIKYLTSGPVQARWAEVSGNLPVTRTAVETAASWLETNPKYLAAIELLATSKSEPSLAGYDFVRKEIEDAVNAILEGGDVNVILDALNEKANQQINSPNSP